MTAHINTVSDAHDDEFVEITCPQLVTRRTVKFTAPELTRRLSPCCGRAWAACRCEPEDNGLSAGELYGNLVRGPL